MMLYDVLLEQVSLEKEINDLKGYTWINKGLK